VAQPSSTAAPTPSSSTVVISHSKLLAICFHELNKFVADDDDGSFSGRTCVGNIFSLLWRQNLIVCISVRRLYYWSIASLKQSRKAMHCTKTQKPKPQTEPNKGDLQTLKYSLTLKNNCMVSDPPLSSTSCSYDIPISLHPPTLQ
jgi:hypothetical protein